MTQLPLNTLPADYAAGKRDTSRLAFPATKNAARRAAAYAFIYTRGPRGATADEVVAHLRGMHNTYAPRVTELAIEGLIVRTAARRRTRAGATAAVYVVAR